MVILLRSRKRKENWTAELVSLLFSISIVISLISFNHFHRRLNESSSTFASSSNFMRGEIRTSLKSFEEGLPEIVTTATSKKIIAEESFSYVSDGTITQYTAAEDDNSYTAGNGFGYQQTTNYKSSTKLPQWMKEYFDWHREKTEKLNESNYKDFKFIFLRCSNYDRRCGGVADRLKSLPLFIAMGAYSNRIFMIRWQRPTKLEEFLEPNEINWSIPDWLYTKTKSFSQDTIYITSSKKLIPGLKSYEDWLAIEAFLQDFYGGCSVYEKLDCKLDPHKSFDTLKAKQLNDFHGWSSYEQISRDLFKTLFRPSPPLRKLIDEKMSSNGLVPGQYTSSHYRAFYAIENQKQKRYESELIRKTENAINCASRLFPGASVYYASDSLFATEYAQKYAKDFNRPVVTLKHDKEALHLDKKEQWTSGNVSDFYPTFIDLLIMAEGRCLSHGVGGFGRYAAILSVDPSCVISHDSTRKKKISICKWYDIGIGDVVD